MVVRGKESWQRVVAKSRGKESWQRVVAKSRGKESWQRVGATQVEQRLH